jgi:hypothetical protein
VPVTVSVVAPLPATAEAGLRLLIVGAGFGKSTVKLLALVAVPPGVVTVSSPELAPVGTTKVSVVAFTTVKLPTFMPLRDSAVAPSTVPIRPLPGVKLTSVGAGIAGAVMLNVAAADVPPCSGEGLATATFTEPAVATRLAGTRAVSWVAEPYMVGSAVVPKFTTEPLIKPVPTTVSVKSLFPASMVPGAKLAMVGVGSSTMKLVALVAVPPGVVTITKPEVAPTGTTKVSVLASTTVKLPTLTPFNVSALAPVRFVPATVIVAPTRPLAGVKLVMVGVPA